MKVRKLNKILGNPGYTISNQVDSLAIGSSLCHKLISLRIKDYKLIYALDAFNKGRSSIQSEVLEGIWDKLTEMIQDKSILDILSGNDEIENPITVYYHEKGKILETFTDKMGHPNTTIDGTLINNYSHFQSKLQAIENAIKEEENWNFQLKKLLIQKTKEYKDSLDTIKKCESYIKMLKQLRTNASPNNN